ncbi:secretory phospholipase A2 receptor-like [Melanotaenia boesemani]|uniref:secretory phospholipase A2 receptor-like n=1 Tax=Melanotaenia boesemani TaxID=1250792 RepID=UPI001C03F3F8|nr:secretory phospholipase A2 receptor-like [Melanotaenia boesemani]
MKSRILGSFFLLFLSSRTVSGLGSVVSTNYWRIQSLKTWVTAQDFCRSYAGGNLAPNDKHVKNMDLSPYQAWIGLYRNEYYSTANWVWSDGGQYDFSLWVTNGSFYGKCAVVLYPDKRVYGTDCGGNFFFICQETDGDSLRYIFILESKTWSEAQQYCRSNHDDLASFADSDVSKAVEQQDFPVWIGLHKDGGVWEWSTGLLDDLSENLVDLENSGDCVSISSVTKKTSTQNCNDSFTFICMSENVILVRENKTWEEALEHCRTLTSPTNNKLYFDLLSVQPSDDQDYLMRKMLEANTEEVWTGLRFLAGEWLWVNGADMLYTDLPLCPILGYHCGALPKNGTGSLEARDCMERKNFLCYSTM